MCKKITASLFVFAFLCLGLLADDEFVKVRVEKTDSGQLEFIASNSSLIPSRVLVEFPQLVNLDSNTELPFEATLPPGQNDIHLFSLTPRAGKSYRYSYSYRYFYGDPSTAYHDDDYAYLLPFNHGTKFQLTQGYDGQFTHMDIYALDFTMDVGTPITAARTGLVVTVKEDSNRGGPDISFKDDGNYVWVYHDDGTFGNYVHFRQDGVVVDVGDAVMAGQLIGYSGNTGYSSGPHVHFDVTLPVYEGDRQTVPTKFLNYDGSLIDLGVGQFYYSTHPGRPAYEVVLGTNITDNDYEQYRQPVSNGSVEVRADRIDNTVLVFASNGTGKKQKIKVEFALHNMRASKPLPYTQIVAAQTEIFLFLLRRVDLIEPWRYQYKYYYQPLD